MIHRDIKPGNILVTPDGTVKLLDFGIAKLLEDETTAGEATELTRDGGRVLTPEYAAPEQLRGEAITTATDVYALGVLLYQLLGGRHPTSPSSGTSAEVVRATLETDAQVLSRAVTQALTDGAQVGDIASHRSTTTPGLRRLLQGDLDNICAKALRKLPHERYGTIAAFADDLRRHRAHEPVSARPDSLGYRTRKFVRRHRGAVATGALTVVAIVGGLVGMIWLRGRAGWTDRRGLATAVLLVLALIAVVTVVLTLGVNASQLWADSARAQEGKPPLGLLGAYFLFIGSVLYGSGYVLVAFLEGGLVRDLGWLTQQQLLDAIALGQFTPGPVLSTATFVGYVLAGVPGAVVATLGIFAPSFLFVAILNPVVPRLRGWPWTAAFLDAVNVSAIGLMVAVVAELAATTLTGWPAWVLAVGAAVAAVWWRVNPVWLVVGGAVLGGGVLGAGVVGGGGGPAKGEHK